MIQNIIFHSGCFISGLEYSASTTAEVVGKPQKSFFLSALAKLNQLYGKTLKPEGKLLILNFTFFFWKKSVIYLGGCSPALCFPSFKNNTWILKLGGSFDNTLCTNPKENSTK